MRFIVALALTVLGGACAVVPTEAPVVVSGTLVDATGQPVPGVRVLLDVVDDRVTQPGQIPSVAYHAEVTSGPDGRFEFRFAPSKELRQLDGASSGFVHFNLTAFERNRGLFWGWSFPREMGIDGWIDSPAPVRLVPLEGVS